MTGIDIGYSLIMLSAVATGAILGRLTQRGLPLAPREKLGVAVGAFCGAMVGAKVPFVLADWEGFLSGWAWLASGKTILCGLVGGYFGVEVAKWALEIRIRTGDSFAVPVAAAVGVGRLACFHAGCCYGMPTDLPWGVVFPAIDAAARHPTQLYEAAFHLVMAAGLWLLQMEGAFRGQLIKLYILSYLAYRFATEFIRPEARLWGELTGYQWATIPLAVLFAWLWYRDAHALENDEHEARMTKGARTSNQALGELSCRLTRGETACCPPVAKGLVHRWSVTRRRASGSR